MRQRLRPVLDTQRIQPGALRGCSHPPRIARQGDLLHHIKIDMACEIGGPRRLQWIDLLMLADRLQCGAQSRRHMAIIDKDRRPALLHQPPGHLKHHRRSARAGFYHRAGFCLPARFGHGCIHWRCACHQTKALSIFGQIHSHFAPAIGGHHQLPHGQRIEKLIGYQQDWPVHRHAGQIIVKDRLGKLAELHIAQSCRTLHKMRTRIKFCLLHRPQRIARQIASARPQFDIMHIGWLFGAVPHVRQPQPDKLAKHLAYFGRCDEVSLSAQGFGMIIVMGVTLAHKLHQADRPGIGNQPPECVSQIALSHWPVCLLEGYKTRPERVYAMPR